MAWIIPKLDKRVQIIKPEQDSNIVGGFDFNIDGDSLLKTVWMGFKPIGYKGTGSKYIRGKQVGENVTHEFVSRESSVSHLGKAFGPGFSIGFKSMADLSPLKSDYYLFVQMKSATKGRLFKIDSIVNINEQGELLSIATEEIEERGTGYPA